MRFKVPVFSSYLTSLPEVCNIYAQYWSDFDPDTMAEVHGFMPMQHSAAIIIVNNVRILIFLSTKLALISQNTPTAMPKNIIILAIYAASVWIWAIISYRKSN